MHINDVHQYFVDQNYLEDNLNMELDSMSSSIPKLEYTDTHYMAHRLCVKVQFHQIELEKESMK